MVSRGLLGTARLEEVSMCSYHTGWTAYLLAGLSISMRAHVGIFTRYSTLSLSRFTDRSVYLLPL